jgi:nitrous oxidase accessory protein NosD
MLEGGLCLNQGRLSGATSHGFLLAAAGCVIITAECVQAVGMTKEMLAYTIKYEKLLNCSTNTADRKGVVGHLSLASKGNEASSTAA